MSVAAIKADFREWSGGFPPDSRDQITVYVDYARAGDTEPEYVRRVLSNWLRDLAWDNE